MDRLISYVVTLCVAASLALAWDRHPPIGWHARVLFWPVGFDLPDSLAVQRDKALSLAQVSARDLGQCRANTLALKTAVAAQNAAVEALGRESEARIARSRNATQAARAVAQSYRVQASEILAAKPSGADRCAAADALILQEAGR